MTAKNILLVNYIFLDEHLCKTSRFNFLESLSKLGYNTHFLAAFLTQKNDSSGNVVVEQIHLPRMNYVKLIYFNFMLNLILVRIIRRKNIHVVLIDPYSLVGTLSSLVYKLFSKNKFKLILDFRSGIFHKKNNSLKNFVKKLYISVVLFLSKYLVDAYTFITNELFEYISQTYNLKGIKYTIWSSAVNENFVNENFSSSSYGDQINLIYHGTLEPDRGLEELIEAMALVQIGKKNIHLDIVGDGPLMGKLTDMSTKLKVKNVSFTGKVSHHQVIDYIGKADIGLILLKNTLPMRTSSPLKLLEYLALNKPVISTDLKNIRSIAEQIKDRAIYMIENSSVECLMETFKDLMDEKIKFEPVNTKDFIKQNYLWDFQAKKVDDFFVHELFKINENK